MFASSLFVPVEQMPSWLQPWAEHQPVSVTATAVRDLMLGGPDTAYHVAQSLAWCVGHPARVRAARVRRYRRAV